MPTDIPSRGAMPTNVILGSLGAIVRAIKSATAKRIARDAGGAGLATQLLV
jgi:hypothetical protein